MPLPSFTVVGNLFEITGEIVSSDLLESAPTTLRFTFTPNLSSLTTPITYGGNLYKVGIVYGGIEDDGTIVQASMVNGQVVTSGDPIQLLAEDSDLNVSGLMWRVALETPVDTRWRELAGWWIDAYADGATVDLSVVSPGVEADANPTFVDVGDVASAVGLELLTAASEDAARSAIDAVSDFDPRLDDDRTTIDGSVTVAKLASTIATQVGNLGSTLFVTDGDRILNADNNDDDTSKTCRLGVPHYSADEDPFLAIRLTSTSTTNALDLGGNTLSQATAANQVRFWTASDNVTAGGTERLRIDNSGVINCYGKVATAASASGSAGLIVPPGSAPSSPADGDVWTTTAGMWVQVDGLSERLAGVIDSDDDERLEVGEATLKRRDVTTSVNLTAGNLRLCYFTARKTETITAIRTFSANTAQVGATLCRVGVYEEDPDTGDLTLVASIANDTSLWLSTGTAYGVNLSASFVKSRGTRYAVGTLIVGNSVNPRLAGPHQILPATELAQSPRQSGLLGGQTDLPASISSASIGDTTIQHYTVLVP